MIALLMFYLHITTRLYVSERHNINSTQIMMSAISVVQALSLLEGY